MADKALVLAINDYESVSGLRGCVNDAHNMARLLTETFGFPSDGVRVVLDREVRKARVRTELTWLFDGLSDGDRAALHFSGHGSQVADVDQDEEGDGLDELLCLSDMDFSRASTYITDDELGRMLKKCPRGVELTVVLDCCHSGTGTRKVLPPPDFSAPEPRMIESATAARVAARLVEARPGRDAWSLPELTRFARETIAPEARDIVLARFVAPPPDVAARVEGIRAARGIAPKDSAFASVARLNHVLLAACQDHQTAADAYIDGSYNGAFTFYLARALRELGPNADRHVLVERVGALLGSDRFEQVPRLEASRLTGALFTSEEETVPEPPDEPTTPVEPIEFPPEVSDPTEVPMPSVADLEYDGAELFRELLATYNRLLDILQPTGRPAPSPTARAGPRHIVYVHGIGGHAPGFSNGWWSSLRPFAPSLAPGTLATQIDPPNGNRHEALWSDLVNRSRAADPVQDAEEAALAAQLREELEERKRVLIEACNAVAPVAAERGLDIDAESMREQVDTRFLGNIDDFVRYMSDAKLRAQVLDRFTRIVGPLLAAGNELEIIAHSWGTVVAYEGLRQLSEKAALPSRSVRHFFTCGAALAIGAVRWNLFGRVKDGRLPRLVGRWTNLNARGDIVGGPLASRGYAVHDDRVDLVAVGCRVFPPNPVCTHASYFVPSNIAVNRSIIGDLIETG